MHLCMTFVRQGEQVLIPNPGYPTYRSAVTLSGGEPLAYTLSPEKGWLPDFDEMERLTASDGVRLFNVRRVRINLDCAILRKYARIKKAVPSFGLSVEDVAGRIRATAGKIGRELFPSSRDQGEKFVKGLE